MKPATRFLLGGLVLVIAITTVAAVGVLWYGKRVAHARLIEQLRDSTEVAGALQAGRLKELQLRTKDLASDPAFVAYVAQSLVPDPRLGGIVDRASISDLLASRREGYDASMVLDATGTPVTYSGVIVKESAAIRAHPLVQRALTTREPTTGIWVLGNELAWVAVDSMQRGGVLQGFVLTATRFNDAFADDVSRITDTGVAVMIQANSQAALSASSAIDETTQVALIENAAQLFSGGETKGRSISLVTGAGKTPAWVSPLPVTGDQAVLVAVAGTAGPQRAGAQVPWPLLIGVALLGLAGILLVILHWSRTYLPLQDIGDILARGGHGERFLTARSTGSGIVNHLRDATNEVLKRNQTRS